MYCGGLLAGGWVPGSHGLGGSVACLLAEWTLTVQSRLHRRTLKNEI
jgi:hypothetical protein